MNFISLVLIGLLFVATLAAWFCHGLLRSPASDGSSTASPTTVGIALAVLSVRVRLTGMGS